MKTSQIIQCLAEDGLTLSVSDDNNLKIIGDQDKIDNWIETIRENKAAILVELQNSERNYTVSKTSQENNGLIITQSCAIESDQPAILPIDQVVTVTTPEGNAKYSVTVTDASADPVLAEVTIAGQASFTLEIPLQFYDGLALLELLEQHNAQPETQGQPC